MTESTRSVHFTEPTQQSQPPSNYQSSGYNNGRHNNNGGQNNSGYNNRGYNNRGYNNGGHNNSEYNNSEYNNREYNNRGYNNRGYNNSGYNNSGRRYERSKSRYLTKSQVGGLTKNIPPKYKKIAIFGITVATIATIICYFYSPEMFYRNKKMDFIDKIKIIATLFIIILVAYVVVHAFLNTLIDGFI